MSGKSTQEAQAVIVAQQMLKAAKTNDPLVLANAGMWIVEFACLMKDPDKWIDMANDRDAKRAAQGAQP